VSLVDRVRAALDGLRQLREIEMFGGVVFEWDGDPLVGVVDDELIVRVPSGWETAAGDLDELIRRAADVVIAECVVRWHAQLRAGGDDAPRAMLALAHHDPEREQLQRILLDHIGPPRLGQLAMTCLGHVARSTARCCRRSCPASRNWASSRRTPGTKSRGASTRSGCGFPAPLG
jgi:hypothetical protein